MRDLSGLSIYEVLAQSASAYPDRTVYDFLGFKTTYSSFLKDVDDCAGTLAGLGISKGSIVSLFLPNIPIALVLFYAISKVGGIANFIHPRMPVSQISDILQKMNPEHVWVPGFMTKTIYDIENLLPGATIHPVRMHSYMPVHLKAATYIRYLPSRIRNLLSHRIYFKIEPSQQCPVSSHNSEDTSVILFTGGTDGAPRGVCLSDKAINQAAASTAAIKVYSDEQDRMLAILPIFHGYGLVNCIHTTISEAACLILLPYYSESMFKDAIVRKKPGYILGIPRLYSRLADIFENSSADLGFFKGLYCGGSKLSPVVRDKVNNVLYSRGSKVPIREGYGLTECVGACLLMPEDDFRPGSIGVPYPEVAVGIVEPGTGHFIAQGLTGEIAVSGDMLMNGYYGEETDNVFKSEGKRWLRTGDLGYMDSDGFVYFLDRLKRMIKIAGYEVFPGKIEALLGTIQGISNCCVVESETDGLSCLRAYIALDSSHRETDIKKQAIRLLKEKLPGWSIPGEFVFVDSIPETLMKKNAYRNLP
ncbi:MAG TPA: class I adenylate-forming enzyme family protein [Clostridia bacterium]|nr:class I adenylate-forming enzyme family protein [Clostridia bacterium]HRX42849.1 class I adenylate-forming enzyme family protein [Clostridia bacterium]